MILSPLIVRKRIRPYQALKFCTIFFLLTKSLEIVEPRFDGLELRIRFFYLLLL